MQNVAEGRVSVVVREGEVDEKHLSAYVVVGDIPGTLDFTFIGTHFYARSFLQSTARTSNEPDLRGREVFPVAPRGPVELEFHKCRTSQGNGEVFGFIAGEPIEELHTKMSPPRLFIRTHRTVATIGTRTPINTIGKLSLL